MMIYEYSKDINSDKLNREVKAILGNIITGVRTNGIQVFIDVSRELDLVEWDVLSGLVTAHSPFDVNAHVSNKIIKAMDFGKSLMVEFGTRNVIAGLTTPQIQALIHKVMPLISALNTGSLNVAIEEIDTIEPDEILTAETIAVYRAKIVAFLATL